MSAHATLPALLLGLLAALGTGACDDASAESLKPCPPKGLGVETASGTSCKNYLPSADWKECEDQLLNSQTYDCSAAQICPSASMRVAPAATAGGAGVPLSFLLVNGSRSATLTISKIEITGDTRCSFEFDKQRDLERETLEPGKSAALRVIYKPTYTGQDHAHLRVHSNAENFPTLILPVCGEATKGPHPDAGPYGGHTSPFACKDPGSKVMPCHQ